MENKSNISKEDFLKLFDSNEPKDLEHLDDFEKEALEGLKMMKNPSIVNSIDTKIDKKLDELVAAEKKGGKRAGLYFLSIAASIALIIGLFFIFKQSEPSIKNEVAEVKENGDKKANDAIVTITDAELKTNSDEKIVAEQAPVVTGKLEPTKEVASLEEKSLEARSFASNGNVITTVNTIQKFELKKQEEGYISEDIKDKTIVAPVASGEAFNDEVISYKSKEQEKDANNVYEEKQVVVDDLKLAEVDSKKDEDASKIKASKKTTDSKGNTAIAPSVNETPTLSIAQTTNSTTTTNTNSFNATGGVVANNNVTVNNKNNISSVAVSEFVGGKKALNEYIKKNLKVPVSCVSEEIVIVKFEVGVTGKLSKIKIASKTGNCPDCEKEALNFVKNMPDWKAAIYDGKPIVSKQQVELSFKK